MTSPISQTESRNPSGGKRALAACTLVVIAVFVYALRRIDQIVNPQLWAEDGVIFFQDQMNYGLGAIFTPYSGYLHLLPRLTASLVGNVVSIDYAPMAYVAGSLLIAALGGLVVAFSRFPWPAGPLFAVAAVMVPHGGEVFLNITNVQWMVAPLLMVIAVQDAPRNRFDMATDFLIIGIVGLTGPFIIFSMPFIVGRLAWHGRSRHNIALAVAASLAAMIQISFVYATNHIGGDNSAIMGMQTEIISNFWSVLLIGFLTQVPSSFYHFLMVLITAMIVVLWMLLPGRSKAISAIFLAVSIMIFVTAVRKWGANPEAIQPLGSGQRYFYIPYVLVTWVFILGILQASKPANWIAMALVLMIIASAARTFQAPPLPDMEWGRHVAAVGTEPVKVPINPVGWSITVHR